MFRKFIFWSHLVLGLAAGLMILVMCVTGVLSAYQRQIQTFLNYRGLRSHTPPPNAARLPLHILLETVRQSQGEEPDEISVPANDREPVEVSLDSGTVYVDPYSGAMIGRPSRAVFRFFAQVNSWHRAMGVQGSNRRAAVAAMDAANLICFYLTAVGLYLWLPRKWTFRHLRAVLIFRAHLRGKARDFNWHNVIGFWMLIPLAVMVWTGVALSYRWADRLTLRALGEQPRTRVNAPASPEADDVQATEPFELRVAGLDQLLIRAEEQVPGWKRMAVEVPDSVSDPVKFTADLSGYGAPGQSTRLQLDREGKVLSLRPDSLRGRSIYRFAHTGELWGAAGQGVALLGCLGGVLLVYTGTALSLRRYQAWRVRKTRTA